MMEFVGDSGDSLDPRIKVELENLNTATEDINKLESELDDAHAAFKQVLSESSQQLSELANKIGPSCIDKTRQYYEVLEEARRAQVQCQYQVQLFQRASEIHAAAKETAALAEARFMAHKHEWNFDQAWQDMLNHATTKVMHAANQKEECEREHQRKALVFHNTERQVQQLEGKHRRVIIKARPYFDLRAMYDQKLATQKQRVECLQKAVHDAKKSYAQSFRALEEISNQIHEHRRNYVNGPREPGVGAELLSPCIDSPNSKIQINESQDTCQTECQKPENITSRLIDGSETPFSQWEIELQSSMSKLEKLNCESRALATLSACKKSLDDIDKELKEISTECQKRQKDILKERTNGHPLKSLPKSPINSVLHRSNLVSNGHFSKSLNNISASTGWDAGSVRLFHNEKNNEDTHRQIVSSASSFRNSENNLRISVGNFHTNIRNNACEYDSEKIILTNTDVFHRSDASSVADYNQLPRSELNGSNLTDTMKNVQSNESSSTMSTTQEFPIFSMLDQLNSSNNSNDKQSLNRTWTDRNNLNTALNDPKSRSIPVASAERLANARFALLKCQVSQGELLI